MNKVWSDIAVSEVKMRMMQELRTLNVGFNEVEEFNLGLMYNCKSQKMKDERNNPTKKVIKAAMEIKLNDERLFNKELCNERNKWRRKMAIMIGNNTKPYRKLMNHLNNEATKEREKHEAKYIEKVKHLKKKYTEDEEGKLDGVPPGLEQFSCLSIFNKVKFANISAKDYNVIVLGDMNIDDDEKKVMRLPPKFGVLQPLHRDGLAFEQELCYAKIRMEIGQELQEEMQGVLVDSKKTESSEEQDARSRMIYDPETLIYNDHNRRVTDLQECSRVTLPKPLPIQEEAKIELRREMHDKIYAQYIKEFCNDKGDQKTNLSDEEIRGIKKIKKRVDEGGGVVMKTDKSGKMCISTKEKYIELGMQHVKGDREIGREELRSIERILNGHGMCWSKMWGTGNAHQQEDRVMSSRVSTSENTSDLLNSCLQ